MRNTTQSSAVELHTYTLPTIPSPKKLTVNTPSSSSFDLFPTTNYYYYYYYTPTNSIKAKHSPTTPATTIHQPNTTGSTKNQYHQVTPNQTQ